MASRLHEDTITLHWKKILNSINAQIQFKNSNMRSGISNKYKIKIINSKIILIVLPASLTHRVCKECI